MGQKILMIAVERSAEPLLAALRVELDAQVHLVGNRRSGLAALRREEWTIVLLDERLAAGAPHSIELLYQNAETAPLLEISPAVHTVPAIVRQVRGALLRRARDETRARQTAAAALESELRSTLTGLLLETQMALREATPAQATKLRHVVALAGELRVRLSTVH